MELIAIFAAFVFIAANVLKIILAVQERNQGPFDMELWKELDTTYIQEDWAFRLSKHGLFLASGFVNAFAWTILAIPLLQLAWLLSKQGTTRLGTSVAIGMFAIGGAFTEWISNIAWLGASIASTQIHDNFNLNDWLRADVTASLGVDEDNIGWKTLEVNHISTFGLVYMVDSFEWLCLAGIFLCAFVSVWDWRRDDLSTFGFSWHALTLIIGMLAFLDFIMEILAFEKVNYSGILAIAYSLINRVLLIPAWFLSLAFILPRAILKQTFVDGAGNPLPNELALTELNNDHPTFTIDDTPEEEEDASAATSPTSPPPEAFGAKGAFATTPPPTEATPTETPTGQSLAE